MDPEKIAMITELAPIIATVAAIAVGGWVVTTWMRIKNGYPLETQWGKSVYPKTDQEAAERVKLLTNENAELRAEIGSMKDRLANVERIVTDDSHRLTQEIEQLRDKRAN
ncbi:MAG: hypothetical protein V7679_14755 [Parasphingorhabdus sp.]